MTIKKWKRTITGLLLTAGMPLSVTGCAATGNTTGNGSGDSNGSEEASQEEQRYAWPLATASPEDTVTQIYAEKFAEEVDRLSDGKMKIRLSEQRAGRDRELLESCYDGDIPFVVQNTAPQVNFIPETAVFDEPLRF